MARLKLQTAALLLASIPAGVMPVTAWAQTQPTYQIDLADQPLGDALRAVATQAGWELYVSAEDVNARPAPVLRGRLTARAAIERLLKDSGLTARFENNAVVISRSDSADTEIVVTGSRIRGAPPAAPVTVVTAEDIRNAGSSDLGQVARSLPQNFGGGQNPGLLYTASNNNLNMNINGASTFNLRGIGPNATLTLLNGNRLSYSGVNAAVDISAVPVAAVERLEVVADGASAIYGADAVAGVANIILKRDYSGAYISARLGAATDGGDVEQQVSGLAGASWASGNLLATYDFSHNSPIRSRQRSFAYSANPETTSYPDIIRQSILLSGHQAITSGLSLSTDVVFKTGEMESEVGYLLDQPVGFQGNRNKRTFESFGIAPTLELRLPLRWSAQITGFYGYDLTGGVSRFFSSGSFSRAAVSQFDNTSTSLNVGAQGPLLQLPAGDARLAIGAGFRNVSFIDLTSTNPIDRTRKSRFAYGELFVPFTSPSLGIALLHRLSFTGAIRIEDYSDSDAIATPKLGAIWSPVDPITFKASWGRSYKLPTLNQQYSGYSAFLLRASGYGTAYPANATLIYLVGANDQVGAERSRNLTLSTEIRPVPDLTLMAGYFTIDYTDRVVAPIPTYVGALANPLYTSLVTSSPTAAQQSTETAGATQTSGLLNAVGAPYDPTRVVAILDGRDRNIARQTYRGIDAMLSYRWRLGGAQELSISGGGSWLESEQVLIPGQAAIPLAGRIFNPPHFKARGGISYAGTWLTVSSFANYTSGVDDRRRATVIPIEPLTTLDLTLRLKPDNRTEVSLSALNLLNAKPQTIYTAAVSDAPFDNTNYSVVGRFLSLTIGRSW